MGPVRGVAGSLKLDTFLSPPPNPHLPHPGSISLRLLSSPAPPLSAKQPLYPPPPLHPWVLLSPFQEVPGLTSLSLWPCSPAASSPGPSCPLGLPCWGQSQGPLARRRIGAVPGLFPSCSPAATVPDWFLGAQPQSGHPEGHIRAWGAKVGAVSPPGAGCLPSPAQLWTVCAATCWPGRLCPAAPPAPGPGAHQLLKLGRQALLSLGYRD